MNGENFDMGMGFQPSCSSSCSGKGGCGCGCGYGDTGPFAGHLPAAEEKCEKVLNQTTAGIVFCPPNTIQVFFC